MKLTILNPDSNDFCEAVGISSERQQVLSKRLDIMVFEGESGPLRMEKMHNVWQKIANFCVSPEELIYCTILHCGWHARRGRILAPGSLDYSLIGAGISMLSYRLRKDADSNKSIQEILIKLWAQEEDVIKEGAREGVQRLLDQGDGIVARDIINKLTGFAF